MASTTVSLFGARRQILLGHAPGEQRADLPERQ